MKTPLLVDAEVKPFEVPECVYICAYMRRSGLEGLRSKKFDGFGMYVLYATLRHCGMVQARAGNERL